MDQNNLIELWGKTLRSEPSQAELERLSDAIVDVYSSGDARFRQHIRNRFNCVSQNTGQSLDPDNFEISMARAFIADEIGYESWNKLMERVANASAARYPLLFEYAIAALWRGDFTSLEIAVGGPDAFDQQIRDWIDTGYFSDEPDTFAEAFAASCMLGHVRAAAALLDAGVDPLAGTRTGLNGFHYAASSGRLAVIHLLIERRVPMEIKNMYGGTVLGQALWSAIYEAKPDHPDIIDALINAGAVIEPGTLPWWDSQPVPSEDIKKRVSNALRNAGAE